MRIEFTIPGQPVPKARPRVVNGHAFTPKKTADYEKLVQMCGRMAMKQHGVEIATGAVKLGVVAFFQIPRSWTAKKKKDATDGVFRHTQRPDWDNLYKAVADGLNGICYADDSQIIAPHPQSGKFWSDNPRVEVIVEEVI